MLDPSGRRIVDRPEPDATLVRAIARGWRWRSLLVRGDFESGSALAAAEGLTLTSVHRLVRLAYLAPDILEDILDGRHRPGLTVEQLCRADFPLAWDAQRRLVGARDAA